MRFLSFAALFGLALAERTGPLRPRQSPQSCDFYKCPSNDARGSDLMAALTSVGTEHTVNCEYFDLTSCYYNYNTGAEDIAPQPCPPAAACVPHSQPITCTSYGCPTILGTTYLDSNFLDIDGLEVWACDYLYSGSQTDTVSCEYFTSMNGQVYSAYSTRPGGASQCPPRISCA
ncbi:hypothetical protein CALCODRAFT_504211 [Calocera cornea HHB12733]|uniref:Cyanovirin-N domain-containing protein n=1 Tax=Calocera cornea HHB12733 TaxID=1353952 RepID=A0A165CIX5_9BASI|nr:hypothetical protein CALCODRAFT_504211 [Calocera cornea HHB12733]